MNSKTELTFKSPNGGPITITLTGYNDKDVNQIRNDYSSKDYELISSKKTKVRYQYRNFDYFLFGLATYAFIRFLIQLIFNV